MRTQHGSSGTRCDIAARNALIVISVSTILATPRFAAATVWPSTTSESVPVCSVSGPANVLDSAPDGAGGAYVVWQGADANPYIQRLTRLGGVWPGWPADGVAVSTAGGTQAEIEVIADGSGGAIVAWRDARGGPSTDAYVQKVSPTGVPQWTANGVPLCTAANDVFDVRIASDGSGGAVAVWTDLRASPNFDVYAQRVNSAGVVQWTANGVAVGSGAGNQDMPWITTGLSGSVLIAWRDTRNGNDDVYGQRLNSAGAAQWPANGQYVVLNSSSQFYPRVCPDGAGGGVFAFTDSRNGAMNWDIYAQRISSGGAYLWGTVGIPVCTMGLRQTNAVITQVLGGVVIAWEDYRSGTLPETRDIFAQRLLNNGTTTWATDGIELATVGGDQYEPVMVPDGESVIVAWTDTRSDPSGDIYGSKVDSSGVLAAGWTSDGTPMAVSTTAQAHPTFSPDGAGGAIVSFRESALYYYGRVRAQRIGPFGRPALEPVAMIPDGAGGTFVAWEDYSLGDADVRIQRFTASSGGAPGWPANGILVSSALANQQYPTLCPDGAGGAFVAWEDDRVGFADRDIYVQRVTDAGMIAPGWPADGANATDVTFDEHRPQIVPDGAGGVWLGWAQGGLEVAGLMIQRLDGYGISPFGSPIPAAIVAGYDAFSIAADGSGGLFIGFQTYSPGATTIMHVDADALLLWGPATPSPDGVRQHEPSVVADGNGGVYVAWRGESGGPPTPSQIFAQHYDATGAVAAGWPAGGLGIAVAAGNQYDVHLASDPFGGALFAWTDERTAGIPDLYGQRVTSLGAASWTAGGLAVSTAIAAQTGSVLVADGGGGALIAWTDARNGAGTDIYASRLTVAGAVAAGWTAGGTLVAQLPATGVSGDQYTLAIAENAAAGAQLAWFDTRGGIDIPDVRLIAIDAFGIAGDHGLAILRVRDVPRDQGGVVQLTWSPHVLDRAPGYAISEYWIWRQIPGSAALAARAAETSMPTAGAARAFWTTADLEYARPARGQVLIPEASSGYYWEFLEAQPATGFSGYSYVAATTSDSGSISNPYTVFLVQARHRTLLAFWNSAPDSGYSADNLAPAPPAAFVVQYFDGGSPGAAARGVAVRAAPEGMPYAWLHWNPSAEPDFTEYRIHRGSSAGFEPSPANLVATKSDTGYVDLGAAPSFYKLVAVDTHGNASIASAAAPWNLLGTPGDQTGATARLASPSPNPCPGEVTLRFALPRATDARLEVFDTAGRLVQRLPGGTRAAGEHAVRWDGRDLDGARVRNGLYFVRLRVDGEELMRRITMLR